MDDLQILEPLKAAADYNNEITDQIGCKNYGQAKQKLLDALAHYPHDLGLLLTANNFFRTCNDHESSLRYAKQIISHHPSYFDGYCRAAQDLVSSLHRHKEASEIIAVGLEKFPDNSWILYTAFIVYSDSRDDRFALDVGEKLLHLFPDFYPIYEPYVAFLLLLRNHDQASQVIAHALARFPNEIAIIRLQLANLLAQKNHFAYRNYLYLCIQAMPQHLPALLPLLHSFETLTNHCKPTSRNAANCDVCCIASDEAPYIAEFIHHYIYLGFSQIFVGINNSSDQTLSILENIRSVYPNVHILDVTNALTPFRQSGCYRVLFNYARQNSDSQYCLFVDVDEFWVADPFPLSIHEFLAQKPAFDVYSFHWIWCTEHKLFAPPLTIPQGYSWDKHLKSICSYDSDFTDLRCHTPVVAFSDANSLRIGNMPNEQVMTTAFGLDIVQTADAYDSSPIGVPGLGWIMHRAMRSELEYSYRLFKTHANSDSDSYFKDNRVGFIAYPSTPGADEYFAKMMPSSEIINYHGSLDLFINACTLTEHIHEARAPFTEANIYNKLAQVPLDIIARDAMLMTTIFNHTRFKDWVLQATQSPKDTASS